MVDRVTTNDGIGNDHIVSYNYSEGIYYSSPDNYFNPVNNEFRGFSTSTVHDLSRDLVVERKYHQDDYRNGLMYNEIKRRASNPDIDSFIESTTIAYLYIDAPEDELWNYPEIQYCFLRDIYRHHSNENSDHRYTSLYTEEQFDTYGNLSRVYDHGIISREGYYDFSDDRRTHYEYKSRIDLSDEEYIFRTKKVISEWRDSDADWHNSSLTEIYHDGSDNLDHLANGLLTRSRRYVSDDEYRESTIQYKMLGGFPAGGLVESKIDYEGNITSYSYDDMNLNVEEERDMDTGLAEYTYWDIGTNVQTEYVDYNGHHYYYEHDGFGRQTSEMWPRDGTNAYTKETITYYDTVPPKIQRVVTVDEDEDLFTYIDIFYDGLGRKIQSNQTHNYEKNIVQNITYDSAGRISRITVPKFIQPPTHDYIDDIGPAGFIDLEHDAVDRLTSIWRSCTQSVFRSFTYRYDMRMIAEEHEDSTVKTFGTNFDGQGNIVDVIKDFTGNGVTSNFRYDGHNDVYEAVDPLGHTISYERNMLGETEKAVFPGGIEWRFDYDGNGNMREVISPEEREVNNEYDSLGRLILRTLSRSGGVEATLSYHYDEDSCNSKGRLAYADSNGGFGSYCYDQIGRVISYYWVSSNSGEQYTMYYTYNDDGGVESITYPDGSLYSYTYNADGTVKRMTRVSDGKVLAEVLEYSPLRRPEYLVVDYDELNAGYELEFIRTYDNCGRVEKIESKSMNNTLVDRMIAYYDNDNISAIMDNDEPSSTEYNYDNMQRLSIVQGDHNIVYTYDDSDRLLNVNRDGYELSFAHGDVNYPWAATHSMFDFFGTVAINQNTFDRDGYLVRESIIELLNYDYSYNAAGMLSQATFSLWWLPLTRAVWDYDHNDRRVHYLSRTWLWQTSAIDYLDKYYENDYIQNKSRKYLIFGENIIGYEAEDGTLYYSHTDQNGSVRYITNMSGEVVSRRFYNPFGTEYSTTNTTDSRIGFHGRKKDVVSGNYGLYRFPGRMYNPSIYQWTALDPLTLYRPLSLVTGGINPYTYCLNDPMNIVDFSGLQEKDRKKINWLDIIMPIHSRHARIPTSAKMDDPIDRMDAMAADRASFGANLSVKNIFIAGAGVVVSEGVAAAMGGGAFKVLKGLGRLYKVLRGTRKAGKILKHAKGVAKGGDDAIKPGSSAAKTGITGKNWKYGKHKSAKKWENRMRKRGWTEKQVSEARNSGTKYKADNKVNPENTATRYVHPETGKSIVVDDVTEELLQVADEGWYDP